MAASPAGARPRLLIVVNVFAPDRGGGAAVFSDMAYGLAERGFDVTVRCAYPYYPEWEDKSGRNGVRVQRYVEHGVTVERYGLFIPRNPNNLPQRLLYEASFFGSLLRALRHDRKRFDATMVFCPLVGAVAYAAVRKRLFGGPLWLNVQDLSAEAAAASGITKGKGVASLFSNIQTALFNAADVWSSISPEMVHRLAPARRRGQPLLYIPNWLNQSVVDTIATLPSKVGRAPAGPLKLLYAGNIGTKQDLLRCCQELARSEAPFEFAIHGSGGRAGDLREWVAASGDERFTFGPFLDEAAFVKAIHDSDLFVITETAGSGGSFIPSKLIPAIATGTPILAVCDGESPLGQEVQRAHLGPHVPWPELGSLPTLLNTLTADPAPLATWQQQALDRSVFYQRDRVLGVFEESLRRMIDGSPLADSAVLTGDG
jgi:colanic acid biosynthesis glycosyl transferase WcaI